MRNTPLGHQEHRLGADRTGWDARSWLEVAVGRNPLIDPNHRREAWIVLATVVLVMVATVISAGAAAATYSARLAYYQAEQATWTPLLATATESSVMPVDSHRAIHQVHACWPASGQQRCDTIDVAYPVDRGQAVRIWIDRHGQYLPIPQPAGQALTDASITAFILWCTLTTLIAATTTAWRRALARSRDKSLDAALTRLLTRTRRDGHRPGE